MATIRQRAVRLFRHVYFGSLVSFGIKDTEDSMFFVEAGSFTVGLDGRLLFWRRIGPFRHLVAVVADGKWQRALEGISMTDFEGEK